MQAIGEYVIGVTAAALICGIVTRLQTKGTVGTLIRFVSGIFLALSVVSPLVDMKLNSLLDFTEDIHSEADALVQDGKTASDEALREGISRMTQTYILDKARSLGLSVSVEVYLSDDETPVPESVTVTGSISPYAKSQLSEFLTEDLGIATEAQIWKS